MSAPSDRSRPRSSALKRPLGGWRRFQKIWTSAPDKNRMQRVMLRAPMDQPDLKKAVEYHIDWTPFDLVESTCRQQENPSSRATLMTFKYVGPMRDRAHFTAHLREALKSIGSVRLLNEIRLPHRTISTQPS